MASKPVSLLKYFRKSFDFQVVPDGSRFVPVLRFMGQLIHLSDISYATEAEALRVGKYTLTMMGNAAQEKL